MKPRFSHTKTAGFTLVEIMVAGAISGAVGIAVFGFLNAGMFLTAKNLSLNLTSNQMRTSLDRVEQVLQQGDSNPVLIDTTGATVTGAAAAGVKLDRFVGGPWVVTTTGGTVAANVTSLTLTRSTNAIASPPVPAAGDIIRIDSTAATLRPRVNAGPTANTVDNTAQRNTVTMPLTSALGTAVTSSGPLTAKIIRPVAFIVMPSGSKWELRYYPLFDSTTVLNDKNYYTVITDQLATQSADVTPFSLVDISGENFVNFSLRVRASNSDNRLRNKQSDEYNTFSRVDSFIRPKVNP
ncbi:MAG: prepilin-type N-terminal cleavage/methylation domain-containing protein [Chthoniobacteraceae bacterium]